MRIFSRYSKEYDIAYGDDEPIFSRDSKQYDIVYGDDELYFDCGSRLAEVKINEVDTGSEMVPYLNIPSMNCVTTKRYTFMVPEEIKIDNEMDIVRILKGISDDIRGGNQK